MTSEQPELLFFDTFSHETSEKLRHQHDDKIGLTGNVKNNGDHFLVESKLVDDSKKEDTSIFGTVTIEQNEGISSSSESNKLVSQDKQDESFALKYIGTSDCDLCELEIINDNETTKSFKSKHDLWIPSNRTKRAIAMKIAYSYISDRELLTSPEICKYELKSRFDQLIAAMSETGTTSSAMPHLQTVSQDEYGLLELVRKEAFTSALNLTAQLLAAQKMCLRKDEEPINHTPQSVQLWFSRLALLVKMQEFALAEMEASCWGDCDKPDLYYQFYPDIYPDRSGSMVPFQMRLLLATIPSYCDRHSESLKRLFAILATVRKILHLGNETASLTELGSSDLTASERLWVAREKRVLISIVNVAVKQKDFILAVEIMNGLIKNESTMAKKQILYSVLGRIHLLFGDLESAENFFSMARSDCGDYDPQRDFQNLVNLGLLAVANSDFYKAYRYFEKASFIDSSSLMVMNNCAVCLFYSGHLREGVRLLRGAVDNDPLRALQDSLILNLCTMLDLNSTLSRDEKIRLLEFASLFKEDLINVSSFRLL